MFYLNLLLVAALIGLFLLVGNQFSNATSGSIIGLFVGQQVFIVAGSGGSPDTLIITGDEYDDDEQFAREEDATSKTAYGNRAIDVDNPYQGNFNTIRALVDGSVSTWLGFNTVVLDDRDEGGLTLTGSVRTGWPPVRSLRLRIRRADSHGLR